MKLKATSDFRDIETGISRARGEELDVDDTLAKKYIELGIAESTRK